MRAYVHALWENVKHLEPSKQQTTAKMSYLMVSKNADFRMTTQFNLQWKSPINLRTWPYPKLIFRYKLLLLPKFTFVRLRLIFLANQLELYAKVIFCYKFVMSFIFVVKLRLFFVSKPIATFIGK